MVRDNLGICNECQPGWDSKKRKHKLKILIIWLVLVGMACSGYMVLMNWDEVSSMFEDYKEKRKDILVIDNPGLESS